MLQVGQVRAVQRGRPALVDCLELRDAGEELGVVEAVHQELVELEVGHCEVQTHCLALLPALQLALRAADALSLQVLPDCLALAGCAGKTHHAEVLRSLQVKVRNAS